MRPLRSTAPCCARSQRPHYRQPGKRRVVGRHYHLHPSSLITPRNRAGNLINPVNRTLPSCAASSLLHRGRKAAPIAFSVALRRLVNVVTGRWSFLRSSATKSAMTRFTVSLSGTPFAEVASCVSSSVAGEVLVSTFNGTLSGRGVTECRSFQRLGLTIGFGLALSPASACGAGSRTILNMMTLADMPATGLTWLCAGARRPARHQAPICSTVTHSNAAERLALTRDAHSRPSPMSGNSRYRSQRCKFARPQHDERQQRRQSEHQTGDGPCESRTQRGVGAPRPPNRTRG